MHKMSFYCECWFVGNFRGKVPIECYIRLFQYYCSIHYDSIPWILIDPLHDRRFSDYFCPDLEQRRQANVKRQ